MENKILVIDDEQSLLETVQMILTREGFVVRTAANGVEAMKIIESELDSISVIMITAFGKIELAVKAMQMGAFNFLNKPLNFKVLIEQIKKAQEAARLNRENKRLKSEIDSINKDKYRIIYASDAMKLVLEDAERIAKTDETALITGESGTGKELVARHILRESGRAGKNFVAFNAAAVHETLIESEIFGHKKGAFTGADASSPGYIGSAEGGTLFIDEIGEMPLSLQSKLLRFLQEKEYMPVGSSVTLKADVRIIAATNKDLAKEIKEGRFREDLYYRLKRFTIHIPPLRDRKEDIPQLIDFYLEKYSSQYKKPLIKPDMKLHNELLNREWRGNVRDLENFIAGFVLSSGRISAEYQKTEDRESSSDFILTFKIGEITMDEIEREVIASAIKYANGSKSNAAKILGISQRTIYRRMSEDEDL